MLQWEWPKTWSAESKEAIRVSLEDAIRKAMANGDNAQIRGTVIVDELNLGCIPPDVALSGIRVLSAEHTAIMVKVRYNGDFSVRLRGLEINLDTLAANAEEADANFALPFFCPFEMTLQDFQIDGIVSIELFHELEKNPQREQSSFFASHTTTASVLRCAKSNARHPARSARSCVSDRRCGYGVLLAAGGRHAMRPPGVFYTFDASLPENESSSDGTLKGNSKSSGSAVSFADILTKKVVVGRRLLKVQLFGDPLKNFRIMSNFATVPGANSKVEGTIRMLIKPAIDELMESGMVFAI